MVLPLILLKNVEKNKKRKRIDSLVMSSVKSLEVEPVAGILQELSIRVNEEVCPLAKTKVIGKAKTKVIGKAG